MIIFALLFGMQILAESQHISTTVNLSVCEVLADDPTRLNGKIAAVTGDLLVTDHGAWLSGECKDRLKTKGLEWANLLSLHVNLDENDASKSWGNVIETVARSHADWERDRVNVTIVGSIETRKSMDDEVVQMTYGLARAGFGHMGGSPAQINLMSVREITIKHN